MYIEFNYNDKDTVFKKNIKLSNIHVLYGQLHKYLEDMRTIGINVHLDHYYKDEGTIRLYFTDIDDEIEKIWDEKK